MKVSPTDYVLVTNSSSYALIKETIHGSKGKAFEALCKAGPFAGIPCLVKFTNSDKAARHAGFLREATYLKDHRHPAILNVLDTGFDRFSGLPFYVSKATNQSLHTRLSKSDLSFTDRLLFAMQICSALTFLKRPRLALVHRAITPCSIFVDGLTCLLGDFSFITREGDVTVAEVPTSFRTPELIEHLKGGPAPTAASDVYQLGLVLYLLFTGKNPQQPGAKDSPIQVRLPKVEGQYSRVLGSILAATLETDPRSRPEPAAVMGALNGLLEAQLGATRKFVETNTRLPQ